MGEAANLFDGSYGSGDERICIAILDGPIDRSHPCFAGARLTHLETAVGAPDGGRALAHGTHVASIVFGQPGGPVSGVAPSCRGLIVPIFHDQGEALTCSQLDLARAILLAVENGAHIINISGGQLTPSGLPDPILAQAIETCARRNVLIVAAAGNDGCACLHVPAAAPSVLAVGAMDGDGRPLESSNWGVAYRGQGILAPGMDIVGALPGGGTTRRSGTSFATPFVSGTAGLLASLQLLEGKAADPHAIRAALLRRAAPCPADTPEGCLKFLAGRIDIEATIAELTGGDIMTIATHLQPDARPAAPNIGAFPPPEFQQLAVHAAGLAPDGGETPTTGIDFPTAPQPEAFSHGAIVPSDCGCGCGGHSKGSCGGGDKCACGGGAPKKPALVYALGKLGYDFGTEARRDSLIQAMNEDANNPLLAN